MSNFSEWIGKWSLLPEGDAIETAQGGLLPVNWQGRQAMLKVATSPEEIVGNRLLANWSGMADVHQAEGNAVLMARAGHPEKLFEMTQRGMDKEATAIICSCVEKLHMATGVEAELIPLTSRFEDLLRGSSREPLIVLAAATAKDLLSDPLDYRPLHGDIHHRNILEFPDGEWRAIDPKGLIGERGFDYANLCCNPDRKTAIAHFDSRVGIVSQRAGIPPQRLLKWILAWTGLSWTWHLKDGTDPSAVQAIAGLAAQKLQH